MGVAFTAATFTLQTVFTSAVVQTHEAQSHKSAVERKDGRSLWLRALAGDTMRGVECGVEFGIACWRGRAAGCRQSKGGSSSMTSALAGASKKGAACRRVQDTLPVCPDAKLLVERVLAGHSLMQTVFGLAVCFTHE